MTNPLLLTCFHSFSDHFLYFSPFRFCFYRWNFYYKILCHQNITLIYVVGFLLEAGFQEIINFDFGKNIYFIPSEKEKKFKLSDQLDELKHATVCLLLSESEPTEERRQCLASHCPLLPQCPRMFLLV